ncbi:MAG: DUF5103 domain-containing protein [Bacteroidetes bacterium]|nr:DUF5103 domain-containing protein [Bacteroidota bacterium]
MKIIIALFCFASFHCYGQINDSVYSPSIKTVQLFVSGNQLAYPLISLNGKNMLELSFDDLDANVKSYFYTYQLCDENWEPAILSDLDFIQGFTQMRISDYQLSSLALNKYTHYHAVLPNSNCLPTKSGNYILKVYLNGDTSQLAFTRRFLVTDDKVNIAVQFLQPLDPQYSRTQQKLQIDVNTRTLNVVNPMQQIKLCVLQNYSWGTAIDNIQPTFYSGNNLQYNRDDDFIFQGGMEWRWLDLQAFHYQSDRVDHGVYNKTGTELFLKIDKDRSLLPYYNYKDYNGFYFIQTTESFDPNWQSDYATVHFSFMPAGNQPYPDKDVYLIGQLTDYKLNDSTKMKYNPSKGLYETALFLKQGVYSYCYATTEKDDPSKKISFAFTEGNHLETENDYLVLVYYRDLGGRYDQLVGYARLNTLTGG